MSRTSDQVVDGIAGNLLPDGWAWNHDPASNTVRSFRPLGDFAAGFEAAAEAQLLEATPDTVNLMLGAYERVLGPDTCLGDPAAFSVAERRLSVNARWLSSYGASPADLIALAASYGATVTIGEFARTPSGVLKAGAPRICHPEEFTVRVTVLNVATLTLPAAVIECVLRRAVPDRCRLVFVYVGGGG